MSAIFCVISCILCTLIMNRTSYSGQWEGVTFHLQVDYTAWGLVMHTDNDAAYASATIHQLSCVFTLYGTEIALCLSIL